jgi:hypothetical protein
MKNIFLVLFCLLTIFTSGCEDDYPDPLGDLIIQLQGNNQLPGNPLLDELEIGIFPLESLLTNIFTSDLAFKRATVDVEEERVVFTNILPGTYVVALMANLDGQEVPKQVVQITADDVTVADLFF